MSADLGRVQGAGFYHTSVASGTSIAVSSLRPQFPPMIGDAVQFPNGDVREITANSGTTVTLGDILYSVKGDPGVGNATLSNTDGDSTENGFTQAAVKGIAQAKNYYELGKFDPYTSNGDGNGTVLRNTRTIILNGSEDWVAARISGGSHVDEYRMRLEGMASDITEEQGGNNKLYVANWTTRTDTETYDGSTGISMYTGGRISIYHSDYNTANSLPAFKEWLSKNPIYLQYKTKTPYLQNVIENFPLKLGPRVRMKGAFIPVKFLTRQDLGYSSSTQDFVTYIVEWIKKVCELYPNEQECVFFGVADPASRMFIQVLIFNTSNLNEDGVPQYATGIAKNYAVGTNAQELISFRISNYSINATTITGTSIAPVINTSSSIGDLSSMILLNQDETQAINTDELDLTSGDIFPTGRVDEDTGKAIAIYVPYTEEKLVEQKIVTLKTELAKVKEDIEQVEYGLVRGDYEANKAHAAAIINELRVLEGKQPRAIKTD